jgi:hypothetical protein
MLTKITPATYDPDAPAPIFQKLVQMGPARSRAAALSAPVARLQPDRRHGRADLPHLVRPAAANGKSTVGNACREAIGDYGDITNVETFLTKGRRRRGDRRRPTSSACPACASSPPASRPGAKINEPLINSVTGGDPMLARDNFRSFFRSSPASSSRSGATICPPIPQGTAGIWRRVKVMLWEQPPREHEKRPRRCRTS